ncbi:MAG: trypsin-like serine protease [Elusimicrobiaceae bacterium]|nr:trypsin-like serine protease [Elusimicrobiaceae bacterium]
MKHFKLLTLTLFLSLSGFLYSQTPISTLFLPIDRELDGNISTKINSAEVKTKTEYNIKPDIGESSSPHFYNINSKYTVSINLSNEKSEKYCRAYVIGEDWFITKASCLENIEIGKVNVCKHEVVFPYRFVKNCIATNKDYEIFTHPKYYDKKVGKAYNIALLHMKKYETKGNFKKLIKPFTQLGSKNFVQKFFENRRIWVKNHKDETFSLIDHAVFDLYQSSFSHAFEIGFWGYYNQSVLFYLTSYEADDDNKYHLLGFTDNIIKFIKDTMGKDAKFKVLKN